ncbi:MAG TPA: hypothetical protein VN203_07480, partial [Candidatus Acidoferrum sp.]|nr:hypothetical protein [Candidatus Acidoferrum sp.]
GDQGATWKMVKDFGSSSTSIGMEYTGLASHYATNWSGLYGSGDGWGGPNLRATIGRIVPTNTTFYVDGSSGVDWTNFGLSPSRPIKSLNYLEMLDIQPGDTVQFSGANTYSSPLIPGWSGNASASIALRGDPASTFSGGNTANTPAVAETFENPSASWNFTLSPGSGSITADTTIVHGGLQSAKVVRGSSGTVSMQLKNVPAANLTEGSTMYLSYWVYYPSNQTSSSDPTMLQIVDNSSYEIETWLYPQSASNLANEISINIPVYSTYEIPARRSLTSGTWHKIYIEDYLHSSSGSFKLYVDNLLWLNINGVKTVTAGGKMNNIYFYNDGGPVTYYLDDFRFGKLPFDARGAVYTNDFKFLDIGNFRFQGANGAVISANSTDIDLHDSIFNALSNDAIENYGSANIALFYNTLFGSGRYGLYSSTNASLTDSVIYNSTTNDVF